MREKSVTVGMVFLVVFFNLRNHLFPIRTESFLIILFANKRLCEKIQTIYKKAKIRFSKKFAKKCNFPIAFFEKV